MTGPTDSSSTSNLEMQSLQLDVQTLQRNREQDRQDFKDFRDHVQDNFQSMQKTLGELQGTLKKFISGFSKPRETPPIHQDIPQGSGQNHTPQGPVLRPVDGLQTPPTAGSVTLVDKHTGKELNLDGSTKIPYRHPHFADNRLPPHDARATTAIPQAGNMQQIIQLEQEQGEEQAQQQVGTGETC